MLELRNLKKIFGRTVAVKNLSIECKENEFLIIFGPAGAGKSTTLRLIAGILYPTAGEIFWNGQSYNRVAPENRNMSMVFENYALYSHLTVFENLAFPLRAKKMGERDIRKRVQEMGEVLQITPLLDRRPGFLSGGQRQRVALGRTLIREANVYLLDEPISHLDAKLRHRMRGELKAICSQKEATVVHVTHDYREAMALSDRVAVINNGHLMQLGTPSEVFHEPAGEFVASFFGDPPMSFLDAELIEEDAKDFLRITENGELLGLAADTAASVKGMTDGSSFRIGVRANALSVASAEDGSHHVPAEVFATETLGFQNILVANIGKNLVRVVTLPGQRYQSKEKVWLSLNEKNIHIFSKGEAIWHPKRPNP
jgi:multiple sugar transport system ATP-binding protein